MAENKTRIQGLEPSNEPARLGATSNSNFYSRIERPAARGTYVTGMDSEVSARGVNSAPPQALHQPTANTVLTSKPVVGFLYSVSRSAAGEYWPLHVGQNTIGQDPNCDIVLSEGTISAEHAVIVVRKMKKTESPEKIIASISDARSTNGTMINGNSLGFAAEKCKNGDIITIGDNYELLLLLIDTEALNLHVCETFIETAPEEDNFEEDDFPIDADMTRHGSDFYSYPEATPGTVGFDGSSSASRGGTVGM